MEVTVDTTTPGTNEATEVPETGELLEAAAGIPPEAVASGEELEGTTEVSTELEVDPEAEGEATAPVSVGTEEVALTELLETELVVTEVDTTETALLGEVAIDPAAGTSKVAELVEVAAVVGRTLPGNDDDEEVSVAVTGQMVVETASVSRIHQQVFTSLTGDGICNHNGGLRRTARSSWRTARDCLVSGTVDCRGAVSSSRRRGLRSSNRTWGAGRRHQRGSR